MRPIILSLLLSSSLSFIATPSQASPERLQPLPKMQHMTVEQPAPAPAPAAKAEAPKPEAAVAPAAPAPAEKPVLKPEEALVKPEDLKEWSGMDQVVMLSGKDDTDKMLRVVEADPGAVPPMGMLFIAKALSEQGRMEEAAFYFYAAQLRLTFDIARWPPRVDPEEMKRIQAEQSKSPDQMGHTNGPSIPRVTNPHQSVFIMVEAISSPISSWLFADPNRADQALAKVKAWDERTKYEYKPNYKLPEPVPFEEWPKLLQPTRDGFFKRMNEFVVGLKKLKSPKPIQ